MLGLCLNEAHVSFTFPHHFVHIEKKLILPTLYFFTYYIPLAFLCSTVKGNIVTSPFSHDSNTNLQVNQGNAITPVLTLLSSWCYCQLMCMTDKTKDFERELKVMLLHCNNSYPVLQNAFVVTVMQPHVQF